MAGLNAQQRKEVEDIAELGVRRYFDHYLNEVFPKQVKEAIRFHDQSVFSHGGIVRRFARAKYLFTGFAIAGGFGTGLGVEKLIAVFAP